MGWKELAQRETGERDMGYEITYKTEAQCEPTAPESPGPERECSTNNT